MPTRSPRPDAPAEDVLVASLADLWSRRDPTDAASEAVYRALYQAIVTGALAPGRRLAEEDIARQFSVSRTPVREAFLRLEAERLAGRSSRRGLIVASVTADEILEIYQVREVLDGLAARLAAEAARASDVEDLRWVNERLRDAAGVAPIPEVERLNLAFHEALYQVGKNRYLLEMITTAHDRVRRFPGTTMAGTDRQLSVVDEHDQIIAAIESRDGTAAEELARRHMARAREIRIELLREHVTRGGLRDGRLGDGR